MFFDPSGPKSTTLVPLLWACREVHHRIKIFTFSWVLSIREVERKERKGLHERGENMNVVRALLSVRKENYL